MIMFAVLRFVISQCHALYVRNSDFIQNMEFLVFFLNARNKAQKLRQHGRRGFP